MWKKKQLAWTEFDFVAVKLSWFGSKKAMTVHSTMSNMLKDWFSKTRNKSLD